MATELPKDLLASLQTVAGFDEKAFKAVHQSREQVVSIRLNPAKLKDVSQLLSVEKTLDAPIPWSSDGYYLRQRPLFTIDPLFHAGAYYVQEASSMFLEEALRQTCKLTDKLNVLDLCAAPGGKSTLIQSLLSSKSLLVSNEVIKARANILTENITKWGAANVVVTNNDPKDFARLPSFFDCIVIDAPCSGSGLFRKQPDAIDEWSINNVELCSQRQQRIIADVWNALKPGGVLIYSTCSYSAKEDEEITDWIKDSYDADNFQLHLKEDWNIVETVSAKHQCLGYRFYPDKIKGEGFFIAAFQKNNQPSYNCAEGKAIKNMHLSKAEEKEVGNFLKEAANFSFIKWQNDALAIPAAIYEDALLLQQHLYIKKLGINMGTFIRDELIPSHELVLSNAYAGNLPVQEVAEETALDYLRRLDIKIESQKKGWAVICFCGIALGLVKFLPNRVNNYYPKDWRILNK
ncbi:MAG TPA: RNA methyltransferase [Ferruginibacter sp.]|nr:RNA methyltransferase [Ferruginibacter sp.]HRE63662.1 RNA methyltransferase [Ferruginibacter sp.]